MAENEELKTNQPGAATPGNAEPTPAPAPQEESVAVPLSKLQALFDKVDGFEKALVIKDQEIAALNESVSSQRLAEARAKGDLDKRPRVHFKKLDGKVVIGWPETIGEDKKNEWVFSHLNPTVPVGEILKCRYYLLGGEKTEMIDQIHLSKSTQMEFARIIEDQGEFAVVKFENEEVFKEPLKVHKKFLNA